MSYTIVHINPMIGEFLIEQNGQPVAPSKTIETDTVEQQFHFEPDSIKDKERELRSMP